MPTHHDRRIFHTTIFIATIFAFVMSSVGAHAQRSNAPPLKRAETTELTDANGNRVIRKAGAAQRTELEVKRWPTNSFPPITRIAAAATTFVVVPASANCHES